MKQAVRAIVLKDSSLLVMKRNKFGSEYYTLVGGHVELGETTENALYRELEEETQIKVSNPRLVYIEAAEVPYGDQYVYLCDYVSGEPVLSPDSDENKINKIGNNMYSPMWVALDKLGELPFRSEKLKKKIIKHIAEGFPEEVIHFSSKIS